MKEGLDEEVFGPLASIPGESIVRLASNIARDNLCLASVGGKLLSRIAGSYNMVHVVAFDNDLKLVIRVPATGWGSGMTSEAANALNSQAATLNVIRERTKIPVPVVHAVDTTQNNVIGAPFICMSYLPGRKVSDVWFEDDDSPSRDSLRLAILSSLAQTMAHFSPISFDKVGSIFNFDHSSYSLGPCFNWQENEDGSLQTTASGPFESLSAFLDQHVITTAEDNIWGKAERKVMETVLPRLPSASGPNQFVLCPPDFDSQNVLVDEDGKVTGLIDWDLVQTMPRFLGYCRYPSWITRDWDPLMYGWPMMPDSEDSPNLLEEYRQYYSQALGEALEWWDDWPLCQNSHVMEAIWVAALNQQNRLEICRKLVQAGLGETADALSVMNDIGSDELDENEWSSLQEKLKRLIYLLLVPEPPWHASVNTTNFHGLNGSLSLGARSLSMYAFRLRKKVQTTEIAVEEKSAWTMSFVQ